MRGEGLDNAIDWDSEKVRRTTAARVSLKSRSVAGPRVIVCGNLADPAAVTPENRLHEAGVSEGSI